MPSSSLDILERPQLRPVLVPVPGRPDLGAVHLDGARRLRAATVAMLEHAAGMGHGPVRAWIDRHSDLLRLTAVVDRCSPECLGRSSQGDDLARSAAGPGDVRWSVRVAGGGVRLEWLLAVVDDRRP